MNKIIKFVTVLFAAVVLSGCAVVNSIPNPNVVMASQGVQALYGWMRIGTVAIEAYRAVQEAQGAYAPTCELPKNK